MQNMANCWAVPTPAQLAPGDAGAVQGAPELRRSWAPSREFGHSTTSGCSSKRAGSIAVGAPMSPGGGEAPGVAGGEQHPQLVGRPRPRSRRPRQQLATEPGIQLTVANRSSNACCSWGPIQRHLRVQAQELAGQGGQRRRGGGCRAAEAACRSMHPPALQQVLLVSCAMTRQAAGRLKHGGALRRHLQTAARGYGRRGARRAAAPGS